MSIILKRGLKASLPANGANQGEPLYTIDEKKLYIGNGTSQALTTILSTDDIGITANKLVQLDGNAKLPAVDGSQLTNLPNAGGAPTTASYITTASEAGLSNERILTGTSNRITVTDNGAGSTVVLSTPQDLHTGATVTFGKLLASGTLTGWNYNINTSGTVEQGLFSVAGTVTGALDYSRGTSFSHSYRPTNSAFTHYGTLSIPVVVDNAGVSTNASRVYGTYSRIDVGNTYTGTITDLYGFSIGTPQKNGSAVSAAQVTNAYGLYVENIVAGTAKNISIYSGSAPAVFPGGIRIGDGSIPTEKLEVYGNITTSGASGNITSAGYIKLATVSDPVGAPTATAGAAGNILAGTYYYKVTFTISNSGATKTLHETGLGPASASCTPAGASQINLTNIPISSDSRVIGRKIYRTKAASSTDYYYVGTIANNTVTTFTDNLADSSFTSANYLATYSGNNTARGLVDTGIGFILGSSNTSFGSLALSNMAGSSNCTALGSQAAMSVAQCNNVTAIGAFALSAQSSGNGGTAIGCQALNASTSGSYNTALGTYAGFAITTGGFNTFLGAKAGQTSSVALNKSIAIGYNAQVTSDNTCVIGGTSTDAVTIQNGPNTFSVDTSGNIKGNITQAVVNVSSVTANTTLNLTHYVVLASNSPTITLPLASTCSGKIYKIKNTGTGTITILAQGSDVIDGLSARTISTQYNSIDVVSDGTSSWFII